MRLWGNLAGDAAGAVRGPPAETPLEIGGRDGSGVIHQMHPATKLSTACFFGPSFPLRQVTRLQEFIRSSTFCAQQLQDLHLTCPEPVPGSCSSCSTCFLHPTSVAVHCAWHLDCWLRHLLPHLSLHTSGRRHWHQPSNLVFYEGPTDMLPDEVQKILFLCAGETLHRCPRGDKSRSARCRMSFLMCRCSYAQVGVGVRVFRAREVASDFEHLSMKLSRWRKIASTSNTIIQRHESM